MWKWISGLLVVLAFLIVSAFLGARSRNRRLDEWARSVPLTELQRKAMRKLWGDFKARRVPEKDPLSELSEDDQEYIKTICSADFRPGHFGSANVHRLALFKSLLEKGYTPTQSAVLVGMTINRIGRPDI